MRRPQLWRLLALPMLAACGGPGHVEFSGGQCRINGVVAALADVETHQAVATRRILSHQPFLTGIAVLIVLLACAGYLQKLFVLFAVRNKTNASLGQRLMATMERYRDHPLRYFSILGGVLALIVAAGGAYIYLDADKRASERALTNLQFCHLALRTAEEQRVLAEQRQNLESIQTTAADIRALVDKLPPEEQAKAKEIVDHFSAALGRESRLVSQVAQRADESAQLVREKQEAVERGLATLDADVAQLRGVPGQVQTLSDTLQRVDTKADALATSLDACLARIEMVSKGIDGLASRPAATCPACVCSPPAVSTAAQRAAGEVAKVPPSPPPSPPPSSQPAAQ